MAFFFADDTWPLEHLAVKYEIMITTQTNLVYDDRKGKVRLISDTVPGVATRSAGDLTIEEWRKRAEAIIHEYGLESLLDEIKDHCRKYCAWIRKEKDLELYAMQCLASKAYESWTEFGRD